MDKFHGKLGQSRVVLGGENVRELLCVRVYFGQQFLKSSGGIMRVGEVVSGQVFVRF